MDLIVRCFIGMVFSCSYRDCKFSVRVRTKLDEHISNKHPGHREPCMVASCSALLRDTKSVETHDLVAHTDKIQRKVEGK